MKAVLRTSKVLGLALAVLALSGTLLPARAAAIAYVATDIADVTPGEDLWRYDYTVSAATFLQSEFFDVYFDASLYGNLTAEPSPSADWSVSVLQQPNPLNLPPFDMGIFDVFANVNNPSLAGPFSVTFVYLGTGTPGSQAFDIFDASGGVLESGTTGAGSIPTVPEPSTIALTLIGLVASVIQIRRRSGIRQPGH